LRNKQDPYICAHYNESSTVTKLVVYDQLSQDLPNEEISGVIMENAVTPE